MQASSTGSDIPGNRDPRNSSDDAADSLGEQSASPQQPSRKERAIEHLLASGRHDPRRPPQGQVSAEGVARRASDSIIPTKGWIGKTPGHQLEAHRGALTTALEDQEAASHADESAHAYFRQLSSLQQPAADEESRDETRREAARLGRMAALSEVEQLLRAFIQDCGDREGARTGTGFFGSSEPISAFENLMSGRGFRGPLRHGAHPGLAGGSGESNSGGRMAGGPSAPETIRRNTMAINKPLRLRDKTDGRRSESFSQADANNDAAQTLRTQSRLGSIQEDESTAQHQPSMEGASRFPGGQIFPAQQSLTLNDTGESIRSASIDSSHRTLADDSAKTGKTPQQQRNRLSLMKLQIHHFLAELVASTVLLTVGCSADCQVRLSQQLGNPSGQYSSQNWAWGLAVLCTIHLAGGISGAHCNPGITISLAIFRQFPKRLIPVYVAAQLLGSFLGAGLAYAIYFPAISQYEGSGVRTIQGPTETGSLFATVPAMGTTSLTAFVNEVVASAILALIVFAIGDDSNSPPGDGMSGLILGLAVTMIGMSLGWSSGYAINAARDFGPRVFLSCVGYDRQVWIHNHYWWIYGPIVGTIVGAVIGCLIYDVTLYNGFASPINRRWLGPRRPHSMVRAISRRLADGRRSIITRHSAKSNVRDMGGEESSVGGVK